MRILRRSTLLALGCCALLFIAFTTTRTGANAAQPGVSASPRLDVMQVVDGEVLDSVALGNRVIVVGTFTHCLLYTSDAADE